MERSNPRLARGKSALTAPLSVPGVGHGGIDGLREKVDDKTVQWGLLRFQVGGGDFRRTKFISICINGQDTPGMARGRLATRAKEVTQAVGMVHAGLEVTRAEELTIDTLIERVLPVFVSDSMDATKLKQLYAESVRETDEKSVRRRSTRRLSLEAPPPVAPVAVPPAVPEEPAGGAEEAEEEVPEPVPGGPKKPDISCQQALDMLSEEDSPLNWFLFEPERFELFNAGSGGVQEMLFAVDETLVLFGVVRFVFKYLADKTDIGFETKVNTRKYYFVHWMGESTSPLKKSKWNRKKEDAQAFVRTKCAIAISKTASSCEDLDLKAMIHDLYRFTAVESEAVDEEQSVEAYLAAIAEEQQKREQELLERLAREEEERQKKLQEEEESRKAEKAEKALEEPAAPQAEEEQLEEEEELPSAVEAILEVRNACGMWDWVLLAPLKAAA